MCWGHESVEEGGEAGDENTADETAQCSWLKPIKTYNSGHIISGATCNFLKIAN